MQRSGLVDTTSTGLSALGLPDVAEQAFDRSSDSRIRVDVVPKRLLDVPFYRDVVLPTLGAQNVQAVPEGPAPGSVRADVTRSTFQELLKDRAILEINVAQPQTSPNGQPNGNGSTTDSQQSSIGQFFSKNWMWIAGLGAAGVTLSILTRAGSRRAARATQRRNPAGGATGDPSSGDGNESDGMGESQEIENPESRTTVVAPASMSPDNVTSTTSPHVAQENLPHVPESRQRQIAHSLGLSPGEQVTVYTLPMADGGATGSYTWTEDGFSAK